MAPPFSPVPRHTAPPRAPFIHRGLTLAMAALLRGMRVAPGATAMPPLVPSLFSLVKSLAAEGLPKAPQLSHTSASSLFCTARGLALRVAAASSDGDAAGAPAAPPQRRRRAREEGEPLSTSQATSRRSRSTEAAPKARGPRSQRAADPNETGRSAVGLTLCLSSSCPRAARLWTTLMTIPTGLCAGSYPSPARFPLTCFSVWASIPRSSLPFARMCRKPRRRRAARV
jgi:hypothetical protein